MGEEEEEEQEQEEKKEEKNMLKKEKKKKIRFGNLQTATTIHNTFKNQCHLS